MGEGLDSLLGSGLYHKTYGKIWGMKLKIGESGKYLSKETEKNVNKLFDISHPRLAPDLHEDKRFLRDKKRERDLNIGQV